MNPDRRSPAGRPGVSWKRALLHGLIPVAVAIGGGLIVVATADVADPERFGEGLGQFSVFAYLAGVGISWLAQSGRRRTAWIAGALLVAMVAALAIVAFAVGRRASEPLTAAERAPLQVIDDGGQRRLVHPTLGFSVRHPGPGYQERPALAAMMGLGSDPAAQVFAYAEDPPADALIVAIIKDAGRTRDGLDEMIAGLERGLAASAREQMPGAALQVDRREVIWTDAERVARVQIRVGDLATIRVDAHPVRPAGRAPFVVALMTMTTEAAALAGVIDSFRAGAPRP
jgi:hypothetical protein